MTSPTMKQAVNAISTAMGRCIRNFTIFLIQSLQITVRSDDHNTGGGNRLSVRLRGTIYVALSHYLPLPTTLTGVSCARFTLPEVITCTPSFMPSPDTVYSVMFSSPVCT